MDPQLYLGGGSDREHESGHSGTAEVQQTTLGEEEKGIKSIKRRDTCRVRKHIWGGVMKI